MEREFVEKVIDAIKTLTESQSNHADSIQALCAVCDNLNDRLAALESSRR